MKINTNGISSYLVLSLMLILLTSISTSCSRFNPGEKESTKEDSKEDARGNTKDSANENVVPIKLSISKVRTEDLERNISIPGVVGPLPDHSIKVSPALPGKLAKVLVTEGEKVKRGQVIAKLEDRHFLEQLEQSKAAKHTAEINLQQAKAALAFAKDALERQQNLFKVEVIAKKDVLAAQNAVQNADLQISTAQSQIDAARASQSQIETELSFTQVKSPIDGQVANRFLNTGDSADTTTPIVQIIGLDNVIVKAALPIDSPQQLKVGEHARIWSDADKQTIYDAKITVISPIIDRASNTISIQMQCRNPEGKLRDGQTVTVSITSQIDRSAILVPQTAIVPDPQNPEKQMVYRVKDGKATRVPVRVGGSKNSYVEIVEGLHSGDSIVTEGAYGLPDGSAVISATEQTGR